MKTGLILDEKNIQLEKKQQGNIIFLVIDNELFNELEQKNIGEERKKFISSNYFLKKIIYYLHMNFDENQNVIVLNSCEEKFMELLFKTLHLFFEDKITIITPYNNDDSLIQKGFESPIFCEKNTICLRRKNTLIENIDVKGVKYEIEYLKSQNNNNYCSITLCLDKSTIEFLKYISRAGVTHTEKGRSQKEFFGHFNITKTELKDGGIIHTLTLDKKTLVSGTDDEITGTPSLYNFHSHPYQAYLKYKTKYGVPSISDYIAVYTLTTQQNTIVHFVSSLEGLYVLSLNPESQLLELEHSHVVDFIKENFIYKDEIEILEDYVKFINDFGLFKLNLLEWEKVYGHNIKLKFNKVGKNCFIK